MAAHTSEKVDQPRLIDRRTRELTRFVGYAPLKTRSAKMIDELGRQPVVLDQESHIDRAIQGIQ